MRFVKLSQIFFIAFVFRIETFTTFVVLLKVL